MPKIEPKDLTAESHEMTDADLEAVAGGKGVPGVPGPQPLPWPRPWPWVR